MWYEKTKSGNTRYKERYTDPVTGLTKTVSVTLSTATRLDQKIAKQLIDKKIRDAISGGNVERLTFGHLVEKYLAYKRENMKIQTAVKAEFTFAPVLRLIDPAADVSKLTAAYVRSRIWDGNATTYNERIKHIKAMFRWAYRADLVDRIDWLDKLTPARHESVRQRVADRYLETWEAEALLAAMTVGTWRELTEFLLLSGLRVGEAQALTIRDVDLDAREIAVNKTYSVPLGIISTTKTSASDRVVYIQDELYELLVRIIGDRKAGVLFKGAKADYFSRDAFMKYVREVSERVLGRRITPHYFRHSHVAMMAAAGIGLDAIARRVGHESSDITRQIYFHVTDELKEKEREQFKRVELLSEKRSKKGAKSVNSCPNLSYIGDRKKA